VACRQIPRRGSVLDHVCNLTSISDVTSVTITEAILTFYLFVIHFLIFNFFYLFTYFVFIHVYIFGCSGHVPDVPCTFRVLHTPNTLKFISRVYENHSNSILKLVSYIFLLLNEV